MKRLLAAVALLALLSSLSLAGETAAPVKPLPPPPRPGEPFAFVHLTDTHVGTNFSNAASQAVFSELAAMRPLPSFIVHGGDITEVGNESEYRFYRAMMEEAGIPAYHVPGNHDSRWVDAGKRLFRQLIGPPYQSFEYGGAHFVLLDSAVNAEAHGHLESAMLQWLAADLKQVGPEKPVLIFSHHPIGYGPTRFIDNDDEFFETVKGYNVRAVFTGHGHQPMTWVRNGIQFFMTRAAMENGYKLITIKGDEMQVVDREVKKAPSAPFVMSLKRPALAPALRFLSPGEGVRAAPGATLPVRVEAQNFGPVVRAEVALDGGPPAAMTAVAPGRFEAGVPLTDLPGGRHVLSVRLTDDKGRTLTGRGEFLSDSPGARLAWTFRAGGGIQGQPVEADGVVYFGANDGKVYAVDAGLGFLRWSHAVGGAMTAPVLVAGGTVFAASTDGRVVALDAGLGREHWRAEVEGAVLAQPVLVGEKLYVAGGSTLYALEAASGRILWSFATGSLVRTRPAHGLGALYVGSWDRHLYAIDAETGVQRWKKLMGRAIYYSPANGTPLYSRGRIFVTTPGDPQGGGIGVHAVDALTGQTLWTATEAASYASPVQVDGKVVISTLAGQVVAYDPAGGQKAWTASTGFNIFDSSPVPFGGDFLVAAHPGRLFSFTAGGVEQWRLTLGDAFVYARPGTGAGRAYAAALDGTLYAVSAQPAPAPAPPPPVFPDLNGHWAEESVALLSERRLVGGYPDGRFRPAAAVTRAEWAVMVNRLLGIGSPPATHRTAFADTAGHWAAAAIAGLEARGLAGGYQEGGRVVFRPDQAVLRAEVAMFLYRALALQPPPPFYNPGFSDVRGHWAEDAVFALAQTGVITGDRRGNERFFRPFDPITRAEAAAILMRALVIVSRPA